MLRATLAIVADTAEEVEQLGRVVDVEVESATVVVRDELLQHELQPVRIEALSLFVAEERDGRKGPLVRIYTKPPEVPKDANTNSDSGRPAGAGAQETGGGDGQKRKSARG
jgi:hypothetical protein